MTTDSGFSVGFKLLHLRKNGTLGPLFINCRQDIPLRKWLMAEDHPTEGYKHRPGWHLVDKPSAPHLSLRDRIWAKVRYRNFTPLLRSVSQGGKWYIAQEMFIENLLLPDSSLETGEFFWYGEESIRVFIEAYIEAMLWSSSDVHDRPLDFRFDNRDVIGEMRSQCEKDCYTFLIRGSKYLEPGRVAMERAGHDFWLTRNGHGCGFWDGGWKEPAATFLTRFSEEMGEVWVEVGDDNKLSFL